MNRFRKSVTLLMVLAVMLGLFSFAAAAEGAALLQGKTAYDGCTFALAKLREETERGC